MIGPQKYRTIVADPPWPIDAFPEWADGTGTIPTPFPTMSVAEISDLAVRDLAESYAHLYLWTTTEFLQDAYGIARVWGFKPSAVLVWCKESMGLGLGGLFASNVEFIIYGLRNVEMYEDERVLAVTRWLNAQLKLRHISHKAILQHFGFRPGSGMVGHWTALSSGAQPSIPSNTQWARLSEFADLPDSMADEVRSLNIPKPDLIANRINTRWFQWPRGAHSAKPEAFLDLVEQVSPGPYLELFARRNRLGWDTWGNECLDHGVAL